MTQYSLERHVHPTRLRSIRASFVLAFVLAVFIPAVIIGILNAVSGVQSSIVNAEEQLEANAVLKAAQINLWLDGLLADSERLSQDENLVLLARQALPDSPFPTRRAAATQELAQIFDAQMVEQSPFNQLFLYDLERRLIIKREAVDTPAHGLFPLPRSSSEATILPPRYDTTAKESIVILFQPIQDRGEPIAILGVSAPLEQIYALLTQRGGLGETGESYLIDNYSALLTPSRFNGYPIGTTNVRTEGAEIALDGSSGISTYPDYRVETVIGNYRWLPQLNAALLVERDRTEVLAPIVNTLIASTLVTVLSVVIVLLAALYFVERRVTLPLVQLSQSAQQIAEGNYQMKVNIQRGDEIGVLANTFNLMSENISHRTLELIRANALAQESVRLKSQFMSTMSHELRTPLNAILGFTGIMLQGMSGTIDDRAKHMLNRINANGQRLLTLIDDVLNIAKIEAGRLELAQEPIDPRALAHKLHMQLGGLAEQRDLRFHTDIAASVPTQFYGDETRISQIITNLLSNAFKFTEKGSVTLSMDYQDRQWIIKVSDTGIGIPPHAHSLIFEAFRQLDGTSRRVYGGSGLGLAIVRSLVTMMNGTIRVESQISKGSTFIVALPLPVTQTTAEGLTPVAVATI
ncbi:MAG: ATP-binding protein [Chloroflexota bacterium]|nr:ATP-binding protein [Chloroflexota bacterium]